MTKKDRIVVIGYGSQGRAWALNLKDSGFNVSVALRKNSRSNQKAADEKIGTAPITEAVADAAIIVVAIPDHQHGKLLNEAFFEKAAKDATLVFLHGSSVHFKLVKPPVMMPVLLLAPHAPGLAVRKNYINKEPYSAFFAVHQGSRIKATEIITTLARGIGIPETHLIQTTFADEAVGDLFGEQTVLCGGMARLLKFGFEALIENGMPPQNAYLEVAYQLDLIVDLVKNHGIDGMLKRISPLARYGALLNGPKIIRPQVKKEMKQVLAQIESGKFIGKAVKNKLKLGETQAQALTNRLFDSQARRFAGEK